MNFDVIFHIKGKKPVHKPIDTTDADNAGKLVCKQFPELAMQSLRVEVVEREYITYGGKNGY